MSDRKKAIETLKQLRLDYEEFYEEHNNEVTQAYDMAIASLETDEAYNLMYEQPEFCKDCISREQAIKEFCKQTCETPNCRFRDKGVVHASCDEVDVLKRLPSVLPKADNSVLEDINKMLAEINGEIACAEYHEVECNHKTEKQDGRRVIAKIVHKYCDKYMESE